MIFSVQASLCCRGTGEKEKESARGTMGRGKKEERPLPYNYSFPYNVVYLNCVTYFISKLITRIWVKSHLQVELSVELRNSYVIPYIGETSTRFFN